MPLFTHTCTIERHDASVNALNEVNEDGWQLHRTAVLCRFKDNVQRQPEAQSSNVMLSPYLLLLPVGTDVLPTDRISNVRTPDDVEPGPYRIAEGPYKRRDGRGATRHLSLGLQRAEVS
jgi:hypothetical protein